MIKRLLISWGLLALAGCTSNGNTLNAEVASILKVIIGGGFFLAIVAAIMAISIKDSSERRVTAGLVAFVAVVIAVFFVLILIA